jgi:hypothetical protein
MREKFTDNQCLSITLSYLCTERNCLRYEHVYISTDRLQPERYCSIRSRVLNGYCAVPSTTFQMILLYTAQTLFNRYYSILSRLNSIDITQYCPQANKYILCNTVQKIQRISLNIIHRNGNCTTLQNSTHNAQYDPPQRKVRNCPEFSGYGSILFTEYQMDFAQYSRQTTEFIAQ